LKATIFFRIAAVVFVLFAAGHTFGFLTFQPPTPEGRAVFDAMTRVHFAIGGSTYSYGNFYRGFGLFITVSDLFLAYLAWYLGTLARRGLRSIVTTLAWPLIVVQLAGVALSGIYFGVIQMAFCLLAAALLIAGALLTRDHLPA